MTSIRVLKNMGPRQHRTLLIYQLEYVSGIRDTILLNVTYIHGIQKRSIGKLQRDANPGLATGYRLKQGFPRTLVNYTMLRPRYTWQFLPRGGKVKAKYFFRQHCKLFCTYLHKYLITVNICTADSESADDYFFSRETYNGAFRGIFRGGRDLFDL